MERYRKLVEIINMYEKGLKRNYYEDDAIVKTNFLTKLSKSNLFGELYHVVKEQNLQLNNLILPYKVYRNKNGLLLYKIKSKEQFEEGYKKAYELLKKYKEEKRIDNNTCDLLTTNIPRVYESFIKEFSETKLDKLNIDQKVIYELSLIDINRKFNAFLSRIGKENYYNVCEEFKKWTYTKRNKYLKEIKIILLDLFNLSLNNICKEDKLQNDCFFINSNEGQRYELDLVVMGEIYKLKCFELIEEKKDRKIIDALLEDIEFMKIDSEKAVCCTQKRKEFFI